MEFNVYVIGRDVTCGCSYFARSKLWEDLSGSFVPWSLISMVLDVVLQVAVLNTVE